MNRRQFLQRMFAAGLVVAAEPVASKLIFDYGANAHHYTTPWELTRRVSFDFNYKVGFLWERKVNGVRQARAFAIDSSEFYLKPVMQQMVEALEKEDYRDRYVPQIVRNNAGKIMFAEPSLEGNADVLYSNKVKSIEVYKNGRLWADGFTNNQLVIFA